MINSCGQIYKIDSNQIPGGMYQQGYFHISGVEANAYKKSYYRQLNRKRGCLVITHTENTGINLQEIFKFIDALKSLGIPVIIEYKQSIPSRLYYRPVECGWTGIALLEKKECGTYLGLLLSEVMG